MSWHTSSTCMKVALVCLAVGLTVYIIGFATPAWVSRGYESYGLWAYKYGDGYTKITNRGNYRGYGGVPVTHTSWFKATQALECIGLICMGTALLLVILYMCALTCKRRDMLMASTIITYISVGFVIVGIAIFASEFDKYGYGVDWSMGIAIVGTLLVFAAAIAQSIDLCHRGC